MCDFLYSKNIFSSHIDLSAFQVYNQNEAVRCTIHNYSNRRSNMNSEMLGISFLQIALGKTDHLVAHINTNDKEPSWDGDVEVYLSLIHI